MKFGVLSVFQNYRDESDDTDIMAAELQLACAADRLGFDSYWATEHHFFGYSMCPDNMQWLAQVAGMTSRIKLGTGAVIVPWNDPYRVAAKIALLDQQSGGRALLDATRLPPFEGDKEELRAPQPVAKLDKTQPPADLWERLRNGFAMSDLQSPMVSERMQWYVENQDYLQRVKDAAANLVRERFVLETDVEALVQQADRTWSVIVGQ